MQHQLENQGNGTGQGLRNARVNSMEQGEQQFLQPSPSYQNAQQQQQQQGQRNTGGFANQPPKMTNPMQRGQMTQVSQGYPQLMGGMGGMEGNNGLQVPEGLVAGGGVNPAALAALAGGYPLSFPPSQQGAVGQQQQQGGQMMVGGGGGGQMVAGQMMVGGQMVTGQMMGPGGQMMGGGGQMGGYGGGYGAGVSPQQQHPNPTVQGGNAEQMLLFSSLRHRPPPVFVHPSQNVLPPEVALTDKGTRLKLAGNFVEAIKCYMDATKINNNYAPAFYNVGVIHSEAGNFQDAIANYMSALSRNPSYVEAYCNIGVIYKNFGNLEMAIHYYDQALNVNPNFKIARNNMAIALTDLGTKLKNDDPSDLPRAIHQYKRALVYNSQYPDAYYNLGVAYSESGMWEKAIVCYELAINFNPYFCEAYNNLGVIYKDRDNLEKAIECYNNALQSNGKFVQTLNNLGVVYTIQGKLEEAYKYINAALEANPNYAEALNNLGVLFRDEGLIKEAILLFEKCLHLNPSSRNAAHNRLLAMNYHPMEKLFDHHRDWGIAFEESLKALSKRDCHLIDFDKDKPLLRIGYLSPDFFSHSLAYFIEGILLHHDKSSFSIYCYSNVIKEDSKTGYLKSLVPHWRNILNKPTEKIAEMIIKDKIDILVDLTGHRSGNRLDVFAVKPAPIQISYLGYPSTTGLSSIDYHITDEILDPPPSPSSSPSSSPFPIVSHPSYVESLIYLPSCSLCFTPPPLSSSPLPSPLPCLSHNYITFGCYCSLSKITPQVINVWLTILSSLPNSRIVIKGKVFSCTTTQQRILEMFVNRVEISRVHLLPLIPRTQDHLKSYEMIDVSLDTWPYGGQATTCESLFMGVPVVTMRGKTSAHNLGASILTQLGMNDWIAENEQDYVRIAIKESQQIERLKNIRCSLREKMLSSCLCNSKEFTGNLEKLYKVTWARLFDSNS